MKIFCGALGIGLLAVATVCQYALVGGDIRGLLCLLLATIGATFFAAAFDE